MTELVVYELISDFEEFSGGNVSLVGGEMFDVGDALDRGQGRIVLAPGPRSAEEGQEVSEAEAKRANRDSEIADALDKYPAVARTEPIDGDEPPSYEDVDISLGADSTREELYRRAQELEIPNRSTMNRDELAAAVSAKEEELAADASNAPPGEEGEVVQMATTEEESAGGDGDHDDGQGEEA